MKKSIILAIALAISCSTPKIEAVGSWAKLVGYTIGALYFGRIPASLPIFLWINKGITGKYLTELKNLEFAKQIGIPTVVTCYCAYQAYQEAKKLRE